MNALDRRELLDLEDRDAEILAAERADQHHDPERLYVPTAAGRAYIFTGDSGEAAGKSTGADLHRKAGSVPRETHRVDRGPTCSPAAPLRDENDTAPARGLVLGLVLGAAMWLCALALAADLGAFR